MKFLNVLTAGVCICVSATVSAAESGYCGELTTPFGPFDYNDPADRKNLNIVERAHFTSNVEKLIKGNTSSIGDDLSYTLAAFPNHSRALVSLANLTIREKDRRPLGAKYSTDCYFERAIRFRPNDGVVRMVYGNYLMKQNENEKALQQLSEAVKLQPDNANINYNLGLLYLKKKNYDQARTYAKKAYAKGYPLPWLKNRLAEAGKWE